MKLNWLKKKLRNWLNEEQSAPIPSTIDCVIDGIIENAVVIGAMGTMLSISIKNGARLISSKQAVDEKIFWKIWQSRQIGKVIWEDGSPFIHSDLL